MAFTDQHTTDLKKALGYKLQEYTAIIRAIYKEEPQIDELADELINRFAEEAELFTVHQDVIDYIDAFELASGHQLTIDSAVNTILGAQPTNSEIDTAIATLTLAKS